MELDASLVSQYLRSNPQFFTDHAFLLSELHVPHPLHGQAVSLAERQQQVMRDKIQQLEGRLKILLQYGEENDVVSAKVHALTLDLWRQTSVTGRLAAAYAHLRGNFRLEGVAIRLWDNHGEMLDGNPPPSAALHEWLQGVNEPRCGPYVPPEAAAWCAGDTELASFAVVRLQGGRRQGVLLLGAGDPQRFYPEMGTVYLARIGDILGAALASARRSPRSQIRHAG